MSHHDYAKMIKNMRVRRGECPECGASESKCDCSSKTAEALPREIRRTKMIPQIELVCPCCKEEIREKGTCLDGEEDGHPVWRHRACGGRFRGTAQAEREAKKFFSKQADIDPNIRASGDDAAANGADVQQPLLRNPYSTGTAGDPQAAMQFENGYQFAQGMGHQQLNAQGQQHVQSWAARPQAWRDGFAQAARGMGCANIANQLDAANKIATITSHSRSEEPIMTLPSFPLGCNDKIASALGAIGGGLTGAAIGTALGAGEGAVAGGMDAAGVHNHLDTPGHEFAESVDPLRLGFGDEALGATHSIEDGMVGGGMAGGAIGGVAGGALGAGVGALSAPRQHAQMPYPSMGDHKMASAYFEMISV